MRQTTRFGTLFGLMALGAAGVHAQDAPPAEPPPPAPVVVTLRHAVSTGLVYTVEEIRS